MRIRRGDACRVCKVLGESGGVDVAGGVEMIDLDTYTRTRAQGLQRSTGLRGHCESLCV